MSVMEAGIAERYFWTLVKEADALGFKFPLPMLRAFVQLGRQEVEIDLREQISALNSRIAELEREGLKAKLEEQAKRDRRRKVWESRVMREADGTVLKKPLHEFVKLTQRREIMRSLRCGLTVAETAKRLGISQATLYRKLPEAQHAVKDWLQDVR